MSALDYTTIDHDGMEDETDLAVLLQIDGQTRWIPRSVVRWWTDAEAEVQVWWLENEGLI